MVICYSFQTREIIHFLSFLCFLTYSSRHIGHLSWSFNQTSIQSRWYPWLNLHKQSVKVRNKGVKIYFQKLFHSKYSPAWSILGPANAFTHFKGIPTNRACLGTINHSSRSSFGIRCWRSTDTLVFLVPWKLRSFARIKVSQFLKARVRGGMSCGIILCRKCIANTEKLFILDQKWFLAARICTWWDGWLFTIINNSILVNFLKVRRWYEKEHL